MRVYTLFLAAIATNIYAVHAALPHAPQPVSSSSFEAAPNSLRNEKHEFHHFDRNPVTANVGRDTGVHGNDVEGSGLYFDQRGPEREQARDVARNEQQQRKKKRRSPSEQANRWKTTKEGKILSARFIKNPDYSQGGGGGGGSKSASGARPAPSQEAANSPPGKHNVNATVPA